MSVEAHVITRWRSSWVNRGRKKSINAKCHFADCRTTQAGASITQLKRLSSAIFDWAKIACLAAIKTFKKIHDYFKVKEGMHLDSNALFGVLSLEQELDVNVIYQS